MKSYISIAVATSWGLWRLKITLWASEYIFPDDLCNNGVLFYHFHHEIMAPK